MVEQKAFDVGFSHVCPGCAKKWRGTEILLLSPAPTQPGVIQVADPSAEIRQLRGRLAEVELERDVLVKKASPFLLCSCVRHPSGDSISFGGIKGWTDDQL